MLASTACVSHVGEHFGEGFLALRSQQIANPAAGSEPADPAPGLEGTTVERALVEYRKPLSEQTAPKQESTILQITN